ncbi:MAG: MoaD/ThiS family protein [Woeseiaceae bacterium]
MIAVTVKYFALFRERAERAEETLETDAETTLELFRSLKHRHGTDDPRGHCKVAVNDVMADWTTSISEDDVVLFFPPVAGG